MLTAFPEFMLQEDNEVVTDNKAGGMRGHVFDGANGMQMVIWDSTNGAGYCERHSHDYGEYCLILNGEYRLILDGKEEIMLRPGDETYIAPGVEHEGWYTEGYRSIDCFEKKRFTRRADVKK